MTLPDPFPGLPAIATLAEMAAALGWTEGKLRNRIQGKSGHPPFHKEGSRYEFRKSDAVSWYCGLSVSAPEVPEAPRVSIRRGRRRDPWTLVGRAVVHQ